MVWWDTDAYGYRDWIFGETWRAFSDAEPRELIAFDGKRVCFREVVMPLLARQFFGLYYNMPLVSGGEGVDGKTSLEESSVEKIHPTRNDSIRQFSHL